MVTFIDQHRDTYGVEPLCAVLPIAPSTYFLQKQQQATPTTRSPRRQRDDDLRAAIQRVWDDNDRAYGPRKVWKQLRRDGHRVAVVRRDLERCPTAGAVRRGRHRPRVRCLREHRAAPGQNETRSVRCVVMPVGWSAGRRRDSGDLVG